MLNDVAKNMFREFVWEHNRKGSRNHKNILWICIEFDYIIRIFEIRVGDIIAVASHCSWINTESTFCITRSPSLICITHRVHLPSSVLHIAFTFPHLYYTSRSLSLICITHRVHVPSSVLHIAFLYGRTLYYSVYVK